MIAQRYYGTMPTSEGSNTDADESSASFSRELPPGVSGPPGWLLSVIKDQRVAFLIVGGINTVVGTLWYWLFWFLLKDIGGRYAHFVALVPTYIFSILCAFVLYRKLVFKVRGHVLRDLVRFSSVYVTTFLLNIPLMWFIKDVLGFHPMIAQVLNTLVMTVSSFIFHKRFSFRRTAKELAE